MRGFLRFLRINTIALLALFVALSGTTVAATNALARNSVGTKQLKKNAVTSVKVKKNAITGVKVRKNAITSVKVKNNAITGAKVKNNSLTGADILESSLAKVPSAAAADTATNATNATNAGNAATVGGNTVRRFATSVASGGPTATVLDLNGFIITLACPAGTPNLFGNNNSGTTAQLRFDGHGNAGGEFNGGYGNLGAASNANLNGGEDLGSGSAHYVRADNTGVTATYGWRNDGPGCRVFGFAVSG